MFAAKRSRSFVLAAITVCLLIPAFPATAAEVFSNGDNLWERLLRRAFDSLLQVMCNVKHIPSDASLN